MPDIVHRVGIRASAERVFAALSEELGERLVDLTGRECLYRTLFSPTHRPGGQATISNIIIISIERTLDGRVARR